MENLIKAAAFMKHNCPICRKAVDSASDPNFPFCSERCRLLDLGNWAAEKYRVAVPIMDESEREETTTNERAADQGPEQGKE